MGFPACFCSILLPDNSSVGADGYDMKGNILAAVCNGSFDRKGQTAAAGHSHAGDGDGTDVIKGENLG